MGCSNAETEIKRALHKHTGTWASKICEFYYHTPGGIYVICKNIGFVICPIGFSRSKVTRTPDGYLIWRMDLDNNRANMDRLKAALSAKQRAPFMITTELVDFASVD